MELDELENSDMGHWLLSAGTIMEFIVDTEADSSTYY